MSIIKGKNNGINKGYYKSYRTGFADGLGVRDKEQVCRICGEKFTITGLARSKKTCDKCIAEQRKPKKCAWCGELFEKRSDEDTSKYLKRNHCCRGCAAKATARKRS